MWVVENIERAKALIYESLKDRFVDTLDDLKSNLGFNRDKQVAELSKVSPSLISELKGGSITLNKLVRLSIGTKFDVVELLGGVYFGREDFEVKNMLLEVLKGDSDEAKSHVFGAIYYANRYLLKEIDRTRAALERVRGILPPDDDESGS